MPNRGLKLSHWVLLCGVLVASGCQYAGTYVTTLEDVDVVVSATPTTAVYAAGARPGEFVRREFEGKVTAAIEGAGRFGVGDPKVASAQELAQPFSASRVTVTRTADGKMRWQPEGAVGCQLAFVSGSWQEFESGEEVVMRLDAASWRRWLQATEGAARGVVSRARREVRDLLERDQDVTAARIVEVLVDEKPLFRLSRSRAYVFFEAFDVEGGFAIETRTKKSRYNWWSYELRPGVSEAVAAAGVMTAQLAVELAWRCVEIGCRR